MDKWIYDKEDDNDSYCPYLSSAFFSRRGMPLRKRRMAMVNSGLSIPVHCSLVAVLQLMEKMPHQTNISPK